MAPPSSPPQFNPSRISLHAGVPTETINQMASSAGWTTDAESGAYLPCVPDEPKARPPLYEMLTRLTDYVAHVEKEVK